jgi:PAS domain S-box-containing protein
MKNFNKDTELEALLSTIPDLIFIFNKDGVYLEVYTHHPEKLFLPKNEFLGLNIKDTLPPEVYNLIKPKFELALKTNILQTVKYQLTVNNEILYFEARLKSYDENRVMCIVRDMTEEEKVKAIDKNWLFAIDSIGDGLWDWNMVTNVVFYSKRFKEMLGYEDEELENQLDTFYILLYPDDIDRVDAHINDYLSQKVPNYEIEFRLKNKSGEYQWILARGKVKRDENGNPIRFAGSHTDIHDKKLQQLHNEDLTRRWEFALDSSGDGIWDWNAQTNKVFFSKRWKEMLGYEENEISDSLIEWESRVHPDDKEEVYKLLNLHLEGHSEIYISQHRVLCKDGSYKWTLDRGKVIEKDEYGKPLRVIGTHTEIDELIKTQNELKRQSILLNDAQEIAQMGAWELNIETGKTYWTDEVYKIHEVEFDFDHNKVNGIEFYHPDYQEIISNAIQNSIKTREPFYEVCKFITAKGNHKWVIASGRSVEEDGKITKLIGMFQDITQEKNNEIELEKTKQKLESILNEINDVVWSVSLPNYKMLFISPSAELNFGYAIEEWMGNSKLWEEIIFEEDKHIIEKIYNLLEKNGEYKDIVYRIVSKNGDIKWVNNSARIIKGLNGKNDRIDGIIKEITTQKIQENEIRYKESIYNSFIKLAPFGIALNDFKTGQFIEINDKLLEPTGYSKEEFISLSYWDLTPKKYMEDEKIQLDNLNKYGGFGPYEKEYIKKDGTTYPVLLNGIKITDINGNELIWCIIEDISDKKRLQNERDNIIELSLDLLSVCNQEGYFTLLNPVWEEVLGYTINEIKSKRFSELIHPEDIEITLKAFENVYKVPVNNFQNRYLTKDGEIVWFAWNAQYNPSDNLIYSITRNITISKQKEEDLERAKLLAEEANKTKSLFLANMSHEIRTPLNSILGFGELLLNRLENPENINFVSSMLSAGKTLLTLINDILDLSKIEANKLKIEITEANPKTMILELSQIFSHLASKKNLTFKTIVDDTLPEVVLFDEIRTRQILLNLLGNALKFTDSGFIEFRMDYEKVHPNKINLIITIKDTGIGIKKDNLSLIFDEFRQQDEQSTRKYGGTGLGLSISKKLANLLGGVIEVESIEGVGSTFKVIFTNLEFISKKKQEIQNQFMVSFKNEELLIVDDNELNLILLQKLLKNLGITNVLKAFSGRDAIDIIKNNNPKVILMDIQMPGMDGIQTTNIIRNELKLDFPIIALTALAMQHNIDENSKYFDDYLTKPIDINKLVETLKKYLTFWEVNNNKKINKSQIILSFDDLIHIKSKISDNIEELYDSLDIARIIEICNSILEETNNPNVIIYLQELKNKSENFEIEEVKILLKQLL